MPNIIINSLDGSQIETYAALPSNGIGPGLIVLHEMFGVSPHIKKLCNDYAAKGFVVLCPNLFWREIKIDDSSLASKEPNWERASKLYNNFDTEAGLRDVFAILAHLRQMKECSGKVGVLGQCLGSRLTYLMASRSDIDCAACYYGVGIDGFIDEVHDIRSPFMIHLGDQDKLVPELVHKKLMRNFARNKAIEAHIYEGAAHGFARDGDASYDKTASALANERTNEFLTKALF